MSDSARHDFGGGYPDRRDFLLTYFRLTLFCLASFCFMRLSCSRVAGGRSGYIVLFMVALLFCKLQTFLNKNTLKSVYVTQKQTHLHSGICVVS